MTLQVRESTYRGEQGFLICGKRDGHAFPTQIFVPDRWVAEEIRDKLKAGEDVSLLDYYGEDTE